MTRQNIDKVMTRPMQRPWSLNKKTQDLYKVFVLSRRNYKVYADGPDPQRLRRVLAVLDTGDGPKFIRRTELTEGADAPIQYGQSRRYAKPTENPFPRSVQ